MRTRAWALAVAAIACVASTVDARAKPPSDADLHDAMGLAVQGYAKCLHERAKALEPSGEPAPVIISNASSACQEWRALAHKAIKIMAVAATGASGDAVDPMVDRTFAQMDQILRNEAIVGITEIRAKRSEISN